MTAERPPQVAQEGRTAPPEGPDTGERSADALAGEAHQMLMEADLDRADAVPHESRRRRRRRLGLRWWQREARS